MSGTGLEQIVSVIVWIGIGAFAAILGMTLACLWDEIQKRRREKKNGKQDREAKTDDAR